MYKLVMTQENREILIKEICSRLPYGVKICHEGWNSEWDQELSTVEVIAGMDRDWIYTKLIDTHTGEEYRDDKHSIGIFDDKLYLRPMSSMTEEEWKSVPHWNFVNGSIDLESSVEYIDWLNSHHFDYRGLIEKSLALIAPKDMYK